MNEGKVENQEGLEDKFSEAAEKAVELKAPDAGKEDLCPECDAVEKTDTEGKPAVIHNPHCPTIQKRAVQLPPWIVFKPGEEIPLKGFRFKVVGYTKGKFELILACVGMTAKAAKKARGS